MTLSPCFIGWHALSGRATQNAPPPKTHTVVSKLPQERHQVPLLLRRQLQLQHEVEELDGVLQRQEPAVVQVGRAVLDAAQRGRLDRAVARLVLEEALQLEVVHLVVEVERGGMAGGALRLAEEQLFAAQLALA